MTSGKNTGHLRFARLSGATRFFLGASLSMAVNAARASDAHAQALSRPFQQFRRATDSDLEEWKARRRSYGGSLIASYAVPLSVTWLAMAGLLIVNDGESWKSEPRSGALLGVTVLSELTTLVAPPIVHWAHDDVGRGFAALGGNLALSFVGIAVGTAGCDRNVEGGCTFDIQGALLGVAVAQTLCGVVDVGDYYANRAPSRRPRDQAAPPKPSISAGFQRRGEKGIELRLQTNF